MQKMRVEMAAMKRDAEHYSRQVIPTDHTLTVAIFCLSLNIFKCLWINI